MRVARPRRFFVALGVITVLAFAGRVAYILAVSRHVPPSIDEFYYVQGARSLVAGDGFRYSALYGAPALENAEHPPLLAILLTPIAWIAPGNLLAMRITVAVVGALVVAVTGVVARHVAGDRAGVIAALLAACYPELWLHDGTLLSESLSSLLTILAVWACYRLLARGRLVTAFAGGAVCGLAMLTRAELSLLLPALILAAIVLVPNADRRKRLAMGGAAVLTATALVLPWVVYNLTRFEEPVFISYGDGGTLLGANCESTYYGDLVGGWNGYCTVNRNIGDPSQSSARARDEALRYARDHLARLPIVAAARAGRIMSVFKPVDTALMREGEARPRAAALAALATFWTLLALAVAGGWCLAARHRPVWPLVVPVVIVVFTAAAFYGRVRFRAPAEPVVVVLAAVALDAMARALFDGRRDRPAHVPR